MTWLLWVVIVLYGFALVISVYSEHQRRKDHKAWLERKEQWARDVGLME